MQKSNQNSSKPWPQEPSAKPPSDSPSENETSPAPEWLWGRHKGPICEIGKQFEKPEWVRGVVGQGSMPSKEMVEMCHKQGIPVR